MFYPRILYEIFKSRIVAFLFRIQNWGWFPGFQVGHWDPSFLCLCFWASQLLPFISLMSLPSLRVSLSLSFKACLHFFLLPLISAILFPLLLPFLPTLEVLICPPHLPWFIPQPFLIRGTSWTAVSSPVQFMLLFFFFFLIFLWKLITISWYILKISHLRRENQDCWNPFPFQFSNEETCGFFGQVERGASRQKSWR